MRTLIHILIYLSTCFIGFFINSLIWEIIGFKIGYFLLPCIELYIARILCLKWDKRSEQKQLSKSNTLLSEKIDFQEKSVPTKIKTPAKRYCRKCGNIIDTETKQCTGCNKQYFKGLKTKDIVYLSILLITTIIFVFISVSQTKQLDYALSEISTLRNQKSNLIQSSKKQDEKLDFYEERAVIVTENGSKYHKYGCQYFDRTSSYWIYNTDAAKSQGYTPCSACIKKSILDEMAQRIEAGEKNVTSESIRKERQQQRIDGDILESARKAAGRE